MTPKGFNRYMIVRGAGRHMKFARLTDSERCAWVFGVLGVAAGSPLRGYLLVGDQEAGAEEVAAEAGVSKRVAQSALDKLKASHALERDQEVGAWHVHDWEDVNPAPKVDRTAAERQRNRRARQATVTPMSRRDNRDSHGNVTPPEVKKRKEGAKAPSSSDADRADKAKARANSDDHDNLRLFIRLGRERNPKMKVPGAGTTTLAAWFDDIRRLRERDGNTAAEIATVIRWVFTDAHKDAIFWGTTIQAPSGLRGHYAQVHAKMTAAKAPASHSETGVESVASLLARRGIDHLIDTGAHA